MNFAKAKACLVLKESEFDEIFEIFCSDEEFLCHVLISDDCFMLEFFTTLIGLDRLDILELDFVEVFSILLQKMGFNEELFADLLLESESVRALTVLMLLFKTENISKRFEGYLPDGEFQIWAAGLAALIDKRKDHFPFSPNALIRAIQCVL